MTKNLFLFLSISCMLASCTPQSPADKQEEAMAESLAWQRAEKKDTEYHYLKYGELFPNGKHIQEVEELFDAIDPGSFTRDELMSKRFTGYIEQFEDKQVLSLRFLTIEEDEGAFYFDCMVNMGAIGKKLNGTIEPGSNIIQFIETEDNVQLKIKDGRIYVRDDKILLESTELDQYWILD